MDASRLMSPDDAPILAELLRVNREFMAPFEPDRSEDYFTDVGQRKVVQAALERCDHGSFDELGLHRIQAGTLVDNLRSQRVLERNGFVRFGLAPRYLHIGGTWQDHVLYQVINLRP